MRADVPVAFIIFNRPDTTAMVFEEIRKAKPSKLYVIADGPRPDREGEKEKTEECRRYVEEHIDWPCTFEKIYSDVIFLQAELFLRKYLMFNLGINSELKSAKLLIS